MKLFTSNEFDDEYIADETNYKLLPEGTYKLTPTVLSFSPDEITKTTELTLIADEIIKVMAENESETVWALAVKLLSYDGEVNPEKESKLFTISDYFLYLEEITRLQSHFSNKIKAVFIIFPINFEPISSLFQ